MNDPFKTFVEAVHRARVQYKDDHFYTPNTLRISQQAIEKYKLFGMDIEIVSSTVLPDGVDFIVVEDKDKIL